VTEYVILENSGDERGWNPIGSQEARGARSAVQAALARLTEGTDLTAKQNSEAQYVAVPSRSWRPVSVKVETKTALRFS
jgi:hypothetical protein